MDGWRLKDVVGEKKYNRKGKQIVYLNHIALCVVRKCFFFSILWFIEEEKNVVINFVVRGCFVRVSCVYFLLLLIFYYKMKRKSSFLLMSLELIDVMQYN